MKDAVPGDTVHLAAGTYASGTATSYTPDGQTAHKTPNRVVVPEGVTLQGDGDAAEVIIKGVNGLNKKKNADAVRCAFLEKNARLKSLTVTNGSVAGGANSGDIDDYGGGVCGRSMDTAFVEDCILTGNFGGRAGALAWGTMVRCRVVGNAADTTGACGRNVNLFGCFVDDNAGNEMLLDGMYVVDCTFGPGNGQAPKHTQNDSFKNAVIANCVILTPNKSDGTGVVCNNISNCIVASGINVSSRLTSSGIDQAYSAADLKLDENGRPAKDSPVVDYGRIATTQDGTYLGATDLDGVPRALGAKQDLGCYEYDWRGDFAADVGTGFSVPAASVGIVETPDGVYVPGGTLELLRSADAKAATSMRGKVVISGSGTLVVTVNGVEAASYAQGTHALKLYGEGAGDRVALTYVPGEGDTGGATLSDFSGLARGMSILLR